MDYLKNLKNGSRFEHTIWPDHCIIGSTGHSVVPLINDALQDWVEATGKPVFYVMKGMNNRTEMYSALEAEVEDPKDISTGLNEDLLAMLKNSDRLIVCGQAMSHSVNLTMRDILKHWDVEPQRLVLLQNGASSMAGYEKIAEKFVLDMAKAGVTITTVEKAFDDGTAAMLAAVEPEKPGQAAGRLMLEQMCTQVAGVADMQLRLQKQVADIAGLQIGLRKEVVDITSMQVGLQKQVSDIAGTQLMQLQQQVADIAAILKAYDEY